jgi:hypothetical protein
MYQPRRLAYQPHSLPRLVYNVTYQSLPGWYITVMYQPGRCVRYITNTLQTHSALRAHSVLLVHAVQLAHALLLVHVCTTVACHTIGTRVVLNLTSQWRAPRLKPPGLNQPRWIALYSLDWLDWRLTRVALQPFIIHMPSPYKISLCWILLHLPLQMYCVQSRQVK